MSQLQAYKAPKADFGREKGNKLNPKQDMAERRRIRRHLRELMQDNIQRRDAMASIDNDEYEANFDKLTKIYKHVANPREAKLDSSTLAQLAECGLQRSHKLQADFQPFKVEEFVENAGRKLLDVDAAENDDDDDSARADKLNWKLFLPLVLPHLQRTPVFDCMLGPLGYAPPKRQARKPTGPRTKDPVAPTVVPELMSKLQDEKLNETAKRIQYMDQTLRGDSHNMFHYLFDPTSYARTVENLFHFSFLVREGRARVEHVDGAPVVKHIPPAQRAKAGAANAPENQQCVLSFDYPMWVELKEQHGDDTPVLEPWNPDAQSKVDAQYGITSKRKAARQAAQQAAGDDDSDSDMADAINEQPAQQEKRRRK